MKNRIWHRLVAVIAIPAIALLYYNQSANWHYHITDYGIVIEHAHPFTNNPIPDTPFQDHDHCDLEYLVLAQLMQTLGFVAVVLLMLATLLLRKRRSTPLHLQFFPVAGSGKPNPTRGPPPANG